MNLPMILILECDVYIFTESACQIYRPRIISFKSYCLETHTHTHTHTETIALPGPLKCSVKVRIHITIEDVSRRRKSCSRVEVY